MESQSPIAGRDATKAVIFDWGSIQWLVSQRQIQSSQMTFGFVEINPRSKNPKHYHPNCDEVLYLIEGELEHSLGDDSHHLTPGASIHIPTGARHDAHNKGDSIARMVVAYSSGTRETVMCEDGMN